MGAPNVQTFSTISVDSAVSGLEIQPLPVTPTSASSWLSSPSAPKICRHSTAIATLEPSRLGR